MLLLKIAALSAYLSVLRANPIDIIEVNNENKFIKTDELSSYRLPNNSIPISYDISITTNIHQNISEFSGNVKIHVKLLEDTKSITLHSRQLEIEKIDIYLAEVNFPIILDAVYDTIESHDFLVIDLPTTYEVNTEFVVDISYLGELRDDSTGFYRGDYINSAGDLTSYAATQFKIHNARSAFPCYDEPTYRAVMQLTLTHGKSYTAISNTEVLLQTENGDNFVTKFVPTPSMQTYTLGFFVSDYEYISPTGSSRISQKVHATSNAIGQGFGNFAASVVGEIFEKLDDIFDVEYPLNKIDNVALSVTLYKPKYLFGAHAMENLGLIMYSSFGFLLDPSFNGTYKKQSESSITSLISHVYANQWFGNIVSPKWWDHSWLSAGIAKFFEIYLPHLLYPNEKYMDKFFITTTPIAFITDRMDSWALNHYTEHPDELKNKFSGINYNKAACVLRMFMEVMGEDVFLDGLNIYLRDNYLQTATTDDLHAAFDEAFEAKNPGIRLNIGQLMYSWENQPGYPMISVSVYGNSLVFTQRRYPESNGEYYNVPLTFATKTYPNFDVKTPKIWLDTQMMILSQSSLGFTPNDWIVLNIDQVGYYRVDYDLTLWRAIINQLKDDHEVISPINRVVLLEEIYIAWTQLDRVTASDLLDILSYLGKEKDSNVWRSAQDIIRALDYKLFGTAAYEHYLLFLQSITKPHLDDLGYDDVQDEDIEHTRLRGYTKIWNCHAFDGNCLSRDFLKLTYYRMRIGDSNFNFCNALRIAQNSTILNILQEIITDENMDYRDDFVHYVGCTLFDDSQDYILQTALDPDNGLESYDREMFLYNMARYSNSGLEKSLNFIDENYIALGNVIEKFHDPLFYIAANIKDEVMIEKFKNTMNNMYNAGIIIANDTEFFVRVINGNQEWMDKNYYHIAVYFNLQEPTTSTSTTTTSTTSMTISATNPSTPPVNEPTTTLTTPPVNEPTTTPIPTTTDSGTSIAISLTLTFICLFIQLFKY